ncbi:hypothetical protein UYSO10_2114 [Kosakonia radicincitans]|nr:hypothetical protein UYSO10_2114 [Kosakonia radicincitans]
MNGTLSHSSGFAKLADPVRAAPPGISHHHTRRDCYRCFK